MPKALIAVVALALLVGGTAHAQTDVPPPPSFWEPEPPRPRPIGWIDVGGGGGVNAHGAGLVSAVALTIGLPDHGLVRAKGLTYGEQVDESRHPRADWFTTGSLLYGRQRRTGRFVAWGAAGAGYTSGFLRGKTIFEQDGHRWHRGRHVRAVSAVADGFVGVAGRDASVGLQLGLEANPKRQTGTLQLTLLLGALP